MKMIISLVVEGEERVLKEMKGDVLHCVGENLLSCSVNCFDDKKELQLIDIERKDR